MPAKIEIDEKRLKELHAKGLLDKAIAKEFDCSVANIAAHRKRLNLKAWHAPGRGSGNGGNPATKRSAIASAGGNFHRGHKAGAADTATIHLSGAALDRLWDDLDLDVKAECIEKILGN